MCRILPFNPEAVAKETYQHNLLYGSRGNNNSIDGNNSGDAGTSKSTDDIPVPTSSDNNEGNNANNNMNTSNSSAVINTSVSSSKLATSPDQM